MSLDTTVGGADANAYATLAQVDAHHALIGNTQWATISQAQREAAIVRATRFLDASYLWCGEIASEAQALRWPRLGCEDRDGREISTQTIPKAILEATAEAALLLYRGEAVGAGSSTQANSGPIQRVKAGSVEVEFADSSAWSPAPASSGAMKNGGADLLDRILEGLFAPPNRHRVPLSR